MLGFMREMKYILTYSVAINIKYRILSNIQVFASKGQSDTTTAKREALIIIEQDLLNIRWNGEWWLHRSEVGIIPVGEHD